MDNIKVGIGFATGRKSFQKVLRTNIYNWKDCGLVEDKDVSLNIFIAYDLAYFKTKQSDYTNVHPELSEQIEGSFFIGKTERKNEIEDLVNKKVITEEEAKKIFGQGYAGKRNALLLNAIKSGMDYLIFMDDDEYPMAVTNTRNSAIWGGQHVLLRHLQFIENADITHGHHCGYISPIPYVEYNEKMTEADFRKFVEAISNDIVNWECLSGVMKNGGVTYADTEILKSDDAYEVEETNGAKFISGANLCINLKNPSRIFPFYNPPGARGEDTFLSTCLTERKVLRVPCYTFHDGFSTYNTLLEGVLPIRLKFIRSNDSDAIAVRFYKACIGWIRYKPLLMYITDPETYEAKIEEMRKSLYSVLPKVCAYFKQPDFINIIAELEKYHKNVKKHYNQFQETKQVWAKVMKYYTKV